MSDEHFLRLFPAVCAGFGLLLAGGVNLLLLRRGVVVRLVATLLALGAAVGGAAALNQPGVATGTIQILAIGLLPCLLLSSRRLVDGVAGFVKFCQRPGVRFGVLTVAGVGVVIGSIVVFERTDEQMLAASESEMDLLYARVPTTPSERAKATTDRGTTIVLKEPAGTLDGDRLSAAEDKLLRDAKLGDQVMRRGPNGEKTNCHGWVFTGGKFL